MNDPTSCQMRRANTQDLIGILALHALSNQGLPTQIGATERQRHSWMRMMQTDNLHVYCAIVNREIVGTASAMMMPNLTYECAPTVFIEAVVVAPGHRRKGIATSIMRRIVSDSRAAGCNKVQLLSHKRHASDGAHHLYLSLGFEAEAEGFRLYLQ